MATSPTALAPTPRRVEEPAWRLCSPKGLRRHSVSDDDAVLQNRRRKPPHCHKENLLCSEVLTLNQQRPPIARELVSENRRTRHLPQRVHLYKVYLFNKRKSINNLLNCQYKSLKSCFHIASPSSCFVVFSN